MFTRIRFSFFSPIPKVFINIHEIGDQIVLIPDAWVIYLFHSIHSIPLYHFQHSRFIDSLGVSDVCTYTPDFSMIFSNFLCFVSLIFMN